MVNDDQLSGWWFEPTPLKNMTSSVGIIIPNWMEKIKMFQTTNQLWLKKTEVIACSRSRTANLLTFFGWPWNQCSPKKSPSWVLTTSNPLENRPIPLFRRVFVHVFGVTFHHFLSCSMVFPSFSMVFSIDGAFSMVFPWFSPRDWPFCWPRTGAGGGGGTSRTCTWSSIDIKCCKNTLKDS